MGSADAGQTSAILFTIVECCRRRGIDPFEYVRDVLDRIPSMTNHQIGELVPDAFRPRLTSLARRLIARSTIVSADRRAGGCPTP